MNRVSDSSDIERSNPWSIQSQVSLSFSSNASETAPN